MTCSAQVLNWMTAQVFQRSLTISISLLWMGVDDYFRVQVVVGTASFLVKMINQFCENKVKHFSGPSLSDP